jgi:hypothetical protein
MPPARPLRQTFMTLAVLCALAACSKPDPMADPAYAATCEGPPLRNLQEVVDAETDGYIVNKQYRCITKESFRAVAAERAAYEAANTPEAKAKREAEWREKAARAAAQREEQEEQQKVEEAQRWAEMEQRAAALRPVEINTASEQQLAGVPTVGVEGAAQIIAARKAGPFRDWNDVTLRVVALSAAQTVASASIGGLTVNGWALDGAPFTPRLAIEIEERGRGARSFGFGGTAQP